MACVRVRDVRSKRCSAPSEAPQQSTRERPWKASEETATRRSLPMSIECSVWPDTDCESTTRPSDPPLATTRSVWFQRQLVTKPSCFDSEVRTTHASFSFAHTRTTDPLAAAISGTDMRAALPRRSPARGRPPGPRSAQRGNRELWAGPAGPGAGVGGRVLWPGCSDRRRALPEGEGSQCGPGGPVRGVSFHALEQNAQGPSRSAARSSSALGGPSLPLSCFLARF